MSSLSNDKDELVALDETASAPEGEADSAGKKKKRAKKPKKPSTIRWKGLLADAGMTVRRMVAIVLAVACVTLTFVQLGFAGLGFDGEYSAYIVVLFLPIALGSLLLGTLEGTGLGLLAGVVLLVHSTVMPLDFYELSFVTPFTSIFMMTATAFLLGIFLARALRSNPTGARRYIYIAIACIIVSYLYSFGFIISVVIQLITGIASMDIGGLSQGELVAIAQVQAGTLAFRLGSPGLQAFADAALMIVTCIVADIVARRLLEKADGLGMRTVFAGWLAVVVASVFMITSAVSFAIVTERERAVADEDMVSEVAYICNQLNASDERTESVLDVLVSLDADLSDLTDEEWDALGRAVSVDDLLVGYDKEVDGTYLVTDFGGTIALADDERFTILDNIDQHLNSDILKAIETSSENGTVQRIVYDDVDIKTYVDERLASDGNEEEPITTQIAYLYAQDTEYYRVIHIRPSSMVYAARTGVMASTTLMSLALLVAVFALVSHLLNRVVARRVDSTNETLEQIAEGNLDAHVEVRGTREFKSLSAGINNTVDALKGWIAEAETRMDAELATAKEIQESALPRTFPPYPNIMKFDVYALMNPAREVGGDFYDFFLIGSDSGADSGKLGFIVADVSGKGVPAALFMMKAKTLIRDYIESGMELGEAIENANRQLCDGNDSGMFVTTWVGVLDYATGHVDYVNAGHNPPLLWQTDSWRWLKDRSGLPLGLFDGLPYQAYSLECGIGDQFLLYSDGVTEAMSVSSELYGEERLEELVNENYPLHPRKLTEVVRRDVAAHAEGAEQSDDITILALEVGVPPELTATLVVPADVNELPRVNDFIHTELDRRLCPKRAQNQLDIAVEELFVNVAHYAYPDATPEKPGMVRVSYTYSAEPPSVIVDISDDGIPYDPLAKPDAVTPDNVMDVPIGGLGILMAKRSVDEMSYERIDNSNVVTIVKKW